jgi:hypothetical protein
MTQYLLSVWGDESEFDSITQETMQKMYADVEAVNQRIREAGAWVFAGGLERTSTATVVREQNGEVVMTDGPYAEAKEHLGGFWVIEAADLDAALAWAKECTIACQGPVEVRPFQAE